MTSALSRVIGVDYGVRRVCIASADGSVLEMTRVRGNECRDRGAELAQLRSWFSGHCPKHARVYIEAPIAGASGNIQTAVGMAQTAGALASVWADQVTFVAPATWKAAVVGHGHSDKEAVLAFVADQYPQVHAQVMRMPGRLDRQDVADAFCLARYGLATLIAAGGGSG